jgi:hypothetical protein
MQLLLTALHTSSTTFILNTSRQARFIVLHFIILDIPGGCDFYSTQFFLYFLPIPSFLFEMFSKSVLLFGAVLAFSAVDVAAHAAINPALGVKATAVRNDVQRPSNNKPCGNAALTAIDTSTAVTADASGSFTVDVENFNGLVLPPWPGIQYANLSFSGKDGSRSVTMQVDPAGTGANFVAGQVTANGEAAPATTGTEKITASLPAGTTCTGGASGNLCLVSFKTAAGFGNCVVVQQGAGGGAAAGAGAGTGNANAGNNGAGTLTTVDGALRTLTANTGAGNGNANGAANNNGQNAATGMLTSISRKRVR